MIHWGWLILGFFLGVCFSIFLAAIANAGGDWDD